MDTFPTVPRRQPVDPTKLLSGTHYGHKTARRGYAGHFDYIHLPDPLLNYRFEYREIDDRDGKYIRELKAVGRVDDRAYGPLEALPSSALKTPWNSREPYDQYGNLEDVILPHEVLQHHVQQNSIHPPIGTPWKSSLHSEPPTSPPISGPCPIIALPAELNALIAGYLAPQSIFRLMTTCKHLEASFLPYLYKAAKSTRLSFRPWPASSTPTFDPTKASNDLLRTQNHPRILLIPPNSVLAWALLRGNVPLATYLLTSALSDPKFDINSIRCPELTFLLRGILAREGHGKCCGNTITAPKNRFRSPGNDTLLHCAIVGGNVELVELLLKHGADPNLRGVPNTLFPERDCPHCLVLAAWDGNPAMMKVLLEAGAEVNAGDADDAARAPTALKAAVCRGHTEIVGMLIKAGAGTWPGDKEKVFKIVDTGQAREFVEDSGNLREEEVLTEALVHRRSEIFRMLVKELGWKRVEKKWADRELLVWVEKGKPAMVHALLNMELPREVGRTGSSERVDSELMGKIYEVVYDRVPESENCTVEHERKEDCEYLLGLRLSEMMRKIVGKEGMALKGLQFVKKRKGVKLPDFSYVEVDEVDLSCLGEENDGSQGGHLCMTELYPAYRFLDQ